MLQENNECKCFNNYSCFNEINLIESFINKLKEAFKNKNKIYFYK